MNVLQQQASLGLAVGLEFIEKEGFIKNRNNLVFNCRNSSGSTSGQKQLRSQLFRPIKESLALQSQSQSFILWLSKSFRYTVLLESRCALRLRYGTSSGLYRRSWTSLPTPFISAQ
jgi:hypothetical protein